MAVTHTFGTGREQCFQEIEKLTYSHSLRGSESLCRLLHYLAEHSLAQPPSTVKEYQIATEVFGRSSHFDPQTDSTVRVQAGRLRVKLAEYYSSEGADDPVVVKLPKGSYLLSFEGHAKEVSPPTTDRPALVPPAPAPASSSSLWRLAVLVLAGALAITLVSFIAFLRSRGQPDSTRAAASTVSSALRTFWSPFLSSPEAPLVIFSNAAFVGRPETGMRYYNSRSDSMSTVYDHYTGVGEVLAIHTLDDVFGTMGRRIRVKRGSLFSLDDVTNNNLIFVGSPSENLSLLDIPGTQEFVFRRVASGPRRGDLSIVVSHPKPRETVTYLASPSNSPLTEDYSVVGLLPGKESGKYVMILAGTTTFGTQGAVEFVCSPDSVEKLLHDLPGANGGAIKPFEALVRVKIARGVPVESELVEVRAR